MRRNIECNVCNFEAQITFPIFHLQGGNCNSFLLICINTVFADVSSTKVLSFKQGREGKQWTNCHASFHILLIVILLKNAMSGFKTVVFCSGQAIVWMVRDQVVQYFEKSE